MPFGSPLTRFDARALRELREWGISTAVILIVVLVLLVLGDLAVVHAWTHRKRPSDPVEPNDTGGQDPPTAA